MRPLLRRGAVTRWLAALVNLLHLANGCMGTYMGSPTPHLQPWRMAIILGGLWCLIVLFQASLLMVSRERAIDLIAVRAANRAQANAQQIRAIFKQTDLVLLDVRGHLDAAEVARGPQPADSPRIAVVRQLINERLAQVPEILNLQVTDPNGNYVFTSADAVPAPNIADRPYFRSQQTATNDGLVISPPLLGRVSQRWAVFSTRRLATADGRFAGILLATLDAERLAQVMQAVDQRQWTLALVDQGQLLAARQPAIPDLLGKPLSSTGDTWLASDELTHRGASLGEVRPFIWARCAVEGLPFFTVAGYAEEAALRQWHRDLQAHLLAAGLLAIGGVAVVMQSARRQRAVLESRALDVRLRDSEHAFEDLVQRIPVGVFRLRVERTGSLNMTYASTRCRDFLGGVVDPLAVLRDRVIDEDRPALDHALRGIADDDVFQWSGRIRVAGAMRWLGVQAHATRLDDGAMQWDGIIQDLTRRREAEAALLRHQELMQAVFDHAPIGIQLVDPLTGVITFANRAAGTILGCEAVRLIGVDALGHVHADDAAKVREALRLAAVPGAPPALIVHRAVTAAGKTIDLETVATEIRDGSGRLVHRLALQRDITDERRLSLQLRQSEKMQAVGLLAGGIAHDFNNILACIVGFAELARRRRPDEPLASHIAQIASAADRAKALVQQILTFSRQGSDERLPVHLQSTVREVLNLLRATMPSSVTMEVYLAQEVGAVLADPGRIHQMLMNLCGNAVQAMGGKGSLRITLDQLVTTTADSGRLGDIPAGSYARLTIVDSGCGMDAATQERIFEPFFTTKGVHEGTGLGLAVVWGVVEAHGGNIQVESAPGCGTTFRIFLPIIALTPSVAAAAPDDMPSGTERILVVDDEPSLREVFAELLKSLGYQVRTCANGHEALAILRADSAACDLLMTDQTMPGMTGHELIREVAAIRRDLPIILCSGLGGDGLDAAGCLHYCSKPVNLTALGQLVRRVLDARARSQ